jgi:16S rRNA (uracil1498-N3)-methyltransferase
MSLRRFYVPREEWVGGDAAGGRVALSQEESRHLRDVLRLRAGDEARVFDGEGREYACRVVEPGRGREGATLEVLGPAEPPSPESPLELTLAVALLKGEKFDLVVQKATELGVAALVPVATRRADVRLRDADDRARRAARWRRLALEAAKQSGRARVPHVEEPVEFSTLITRAAREGHARVLFAERGGGSIAEALGGDAAAGVGLTALVGPEGGWEPAEVESARDAGWKIVTLGGRVLRAETAALAVAAILQHLYGDVR